MGVAAENAGEAQEELSALPRARHGRRQGLASATFEDMSALAEAAAPGV